MNEKPTIKVPLYRIEGVKGLQVGRCDCVTQRLYNSAITGTGQDVALGISRDAGNASRTCKVCGLYYDSIGKIVHEGVVTFIAWAYSTPERRG